MSQRRLFAAPYYTLTAVERHFQGLWPQKLTSGASSLCTVTSFSGFMATKTHIWGILSLHSDFRLEASHIKVTTLSDMLPIYTLFASLHLTRPQAELRMNSRFSISH